MIDVCDVGPRRPISVGAMTDDLDLVVHAFERAVAQPEFRPDQHAVEMTAQHPGELLERFEAAVTGAPNHCNRWPPAHAVLR